jgi:hypothetical protein
VLDTGDENQALLAFYRVLGTIEPVAKTEEADTGKYKYKYPPLAAVIEEVKRACALHGLVITQWPGGQDGFLTLRTVLIHENGDTLSFDPMVMKLPAEPQSYGSALSYAKRYSLTAIFAIATEDDDGALATQAERAPAQYGGSRTRAEQLIREALSNARPELRGEVQASFKEHFGCSLSELPTARHGEALTFVNESLSVRAEANGADEADAQWTAAAQGKTK